MQDVLRSTWREPRPHRPPKRVWRDWALVGVVVSAAVLEAVLRPDLPWRVLWAAVLVGLAPTLLWRRTRPLLVVGLAFGVTGVVALVTGGDPEPHTSVFVLVLVYSVVRWGSGREASVGLAVVVVGACLSMAVRALAFADVIGGLTVLFAVTALGVAMRYRSRLRTRELDRVKLLERERLARDLHDTVAHHVSAIAIRAQAGLAVADPDAAADALRLIEDEATRALAEMRAMVRVLRRDEPADLAPSPRIADLERLVTDTSPSVEVDVTGDLDGVHPSVDAAIYRLAQEAVTNARRHARHATRVEVHVAADDTSVHLRVSDDGDGPARTTPGYGLIGMFERVDLLGGTCAAGPDGKGWTVTATVPRSGS